MFWDVQIIEIQIAMSTDKAVWTQPCSFAQLRSDCYWIMRAESESVKQLLSASSQLDYQEMLYWFIFFLPLETEHYSDYVQLSSGIIFPVILFNIQANVSPRIGLSICSVLRWFPACKAPIASLRRDSLSPLLQPVYKAKPSKAPSLGPPWIIQLLAAKEAGKHRYLMFAVFLFQRQRRRLRTGQ